TNSTITLYYTWCKDAGKSNQFTEGTQSLRKQTIERHLIINDHQKAIIAWDNRQTKLMQGFTRQLSIQKLTIISLIQNIYYLSKNNQAITQFFNLCQLNHLQTINQEQLYFEIEPIVLKSNNKNFNQSNQSRNEYATYENPISGRIFLKTISFTIKHEVIQEILNSKYWSILIDKSTIFTNKHLAVVTKHLSENKPILHYFEMIKLEDCSAESFTINLKRFILAKLLNIENLVHFGSDGTSTMLGHQNRVAACQDAAEKILYFEKYEKLVKEIYTYFSSSYKRLLKLKMVQNTLEEPELMILNISIKRALLDEAANNMQAAILLADINQTFEIHAMHYKLNLLVNNILPTYGQILLKYIEENNLDTSQFSTFISEFASATITSLNNHFPNLEFYKAIKIYDPKQLPISNNDLANYGNEVINILSNFYGTEKVINNQQFIPPLEKKRFN
ncbi:15059_t:CDS:2, partial [Dentiscutata heterogama]